MGCSMYLERTNILERSDEKVILEFIELIQSRNINYEFENSTTLYIWKDKRKNGLRVYLSSAQEDNYPEPFGVYFREISFDAIYSDDECTNSDLLLEVADVYMQKYPDTLLFGECSPYLYYDKTDIDIVLKKPFYKEWYFQTISHSSPFLDEVVK